METQPETPISADDVFKEREKRWKQLTDREKGREIALLETTEARRMEAVNRIDATYNLVGAVAHAYMAIHGVIPDKETQQRLIGRVTESLYDAVIAAKP